MTDTLKSESSEQQEVPIDDIELARMHEVVEHFCETAKDTNGLTWLTQIDHPDNQRIVENPTLRKLLEEIGGIPENGISYYQIELTPLKSDLDDELRHERVVAAGVVNSGEEFRITSTIYMHEEGSATEAINIKFGQLKDDHLKMTRYLEYLERCYELLSN